MRKRRVTCLVTGQQYIVEKECGRTIRLIKEGTTYRSTWRKSTFYTHFKEDRE